MQLKCLLHVSPIKLKLILFSKTVSPPKISGGLVTLPEWPRLENFDSPCWHNSRPTSWLGLGSGKLSFSADGAFYVCSSDLSPPSATTSTRIVEVFRIMETSIFFGRHGRVTACVHRRCFSCVFQSSLVCLMEQIAFILINTAVCRLRTSSHYTRATRSYMHDA